MLFIACGAQDKVTENVMKANPLRLPASVRCNVLAKLFAQLRSGVLSDIEDPAVSCCLLTNAIFI